MVLQQSATIVMQQQVVCTAPAHCRICSSSHRCSKAESALQSQVSDDVPMADHVKASKPGILRRVAQRFVSRIKLSPVKRAMPGCNCF